MSAKQETLALLEQLPDDSPAWCELREEARLFRAIVSAEADIREGRTISLEAAMEQMEQKWRQRATKSN